MPVLVMDKMASQKLQINIYLTVMQELSNIERFREAVKVLCNLYLD
jgi:hypothetical protein